MDRAAKLAAEARIFVEFEKEWRGATGMANAARHLTRLALGDVAREEGFAENEISAAVDEALTAAGTTP